MLKEQIKNEIFKKIKTSNYLKYEDIVNFFNLSLSSAKRYCQELAKENKIRLIRGGITSNFNIELDNPSKQKINIKAKQTIAKRAIEKINDYDVIFLDAGTSTIEIAKILPENRNIVVFTNNIDIINFLSSKTIKTYLIGGKVNFNTSALTGSWAINAINELKVNIAFIGCNGYDDVFLYTTNLEESIFKKNLIKISDQSYFLADSSKKNKKFPYKITELKKTNIIK